ncbi:putative RNA-directed DNA polymerase, eukaryota, reverse transcriptase zinc-binding domain protein [Tanacetum coccineum]
MHGAIIGFKLVEVKGSLNFGPRPFKVFDKWLNVAEFRDLVSSSWATPFAPTPPDILLKNKLRSTRLDIKKWGYQSTRYLKKGWDPQNLLDWDEKAEDGGINQHDISKREEWVMDLLQLDRLRNEDLKQKCRIRWAVEGDEDSRFFHSILSHMFAKGTIKGININGIWVKSPSNIKQAALDHFSSRFKELIEVKVAVWDCAGSKAPGPDGFNFNFIKSFWDVVKIYFWNCISHFEATGTLKKGYNPSFTVLIPKKFDPIGFSDFKPISLIGCVYKVISKILASRLAKVIDSIIGPNQSAFIKGRQILDGCLIANEIIRMETLEDQRMLLFKVDFEKSFDSVNWNFLLDVMRQMGFGLKWRNCIASCLSSASISVLIKGSPSKEFFMECGLRQGDPLSPFLFLLAAEALQVTILRACDRGIFKGVCLANSRNNISLLQFADDALFW